MSVSESQDKSVFNKEKDIVYSDREYKALHDFEPKAPQQIHLTKGDTVIVIEKPDGGWWKGTSKGQTGYFPATYVEPIKTIKKKPLAHTSNFIKKLQKDAGLVEESSSDEEATKKRMEEKKERMQRKTQETLNQKYTSAPIPPTTPEPASLTTTTATSSSQSNRPVSPSRSSLSNRARPSTEVEVSTLTPTKAEEQKASFAESPLPRTPSNEKKMLEVQEALAENVSGTIVTDPSTIFKRIFYSLLPVTSPVVSDERVDMIGPALIFIIVSVVLLFSGPHSTVHDARTVILTLFLYWMTSSLVCYLICIVFRIKIKLFQIYSLIGYGFFGPSLGVAFDVSYHSSLCFLFTIISSLHLGITMWRRSTWSALGFIGGLLFSSIHFLFFLYLSP